MKKLYSILLASLIAARPIVVTLTCLSVYFLMMLTVIGAILFFLFGILAVWSTFYDLLT